MEDYRPNCNYCNTLIPNPSKWKRHCKTKKHQRNKERFLKENTEEHKENTKEHKENTKLVKKDPVDKIQYECNHCDKTFNTRTKPLRPLFKVTFTITPVLLIFI